MRDREIDRKFAGTAQLQQLDPITHSHRIGGIGERDHRSVVTEWAAVVHVRHRDEIVPEHEALQPDEREYASQFTAGAAGAEIGAVEAVGPFDDLTPSKAMERGPADLLAAEGVPLLGGAGERLDGDGRVGHEGNASGRERAVERSVIDEQYSVRVSGPHAHVGMRLGTALSRGTSRTTRIT